MVGATLFGLLRTYPRVSINLRPFYLVTWMSTIVLITYGLLDSEIYISGGASLIFAPFGFALLLLIMPARETHQAEPVWKAEGESTRKMVAVADAVGWHHAQLCLVGCIPFLLLAVLWLRPGAQAAQQANWGAVAQARAELSLYQRTMWPLQDAMRRNGVDLTTAMDYYYSSLALNPNNVTAHRRLGQILLSQGNMTAAQQHLVLAHTAAPNQLVTRQLLGEVYGVTGQIEEAALLWRTVDNTNGQLEMRYWWYNYLGAQTEADRIKQVIGAVSH